MGARTSIALVALVAGASVGLGCSSTAIAQAPPPSEAQTTGTPTPRVPEVVTHPPPDPTSDPNAASCTGEPGSFYALSARKLGGTEEIPLCRFRGDVVMIVNTASHCGYTPEFTPLQQIYDDYRDKGFYVLGFPSATFNQEFADEKDISAFCTTQYGITFPMFAIGNVNPPDEQPLYTWLKSQPGENTPVGWNFEKFLVSKSGKVAARFATAIEPDDAQVTKAIEAELAK